jgi:hypothetical protein
MLNAEPDSRGLVPAIHVFFLQRSKDVDARDKPGHDDLLCSYRRELYACPAAVLPSAACAAARRAIGTR